MGTLFYLLDLLKVYEVLKPVSLFILERKVFSRSAEHMTQLHVELGLSMWWKAGFGGFGTTEMSRQNSFHKIPQNTSECTWNPANFLIQLPILPGDILTWLEAEGTKPMTSRPP